MERSFSVLTCAEVPRPSIRSSGNGKSRPGSLADFLVARPSATCFTAELRCPLETRRNRYLFDIWALTLGYLICMCDFISSSVQPSRWALFPLFYSQGNTLGKLSEFPGATLAVKAQHRRIPGWSSQPQSPSLFLGTRGDGSRVTDYSSDQSS